MKRLFLLIAALHFHVPSATGQEAPRKSYEEINSNVTPRNIKDFKDYLALCPRNEIRCIWFIEDHIKVGMLMTIDLQASNVETMRNVYDWAEQNRSVRIMSHTQISTARSVVEALSPGPKDLLFGKGLHIAFWKDGMHRTVSYDRGAVPIAVQRLYDAAGGELVCVYQGK